MHEASAVLPVLTYLFHRLEAQFDGRPSLFTAANATFALKAGECVRRALFLIFAPDSRLESSPLSGRKSTHAAVRISGASS